MKLRCPTCCKKLKARLQFIGKRVMCPGCEAIFRLPDNGIRPIAEPTGKTLLHRFVARSRN